MTAATKRTAALSPWRWAVLGSFMLINLTIQTLWIGYASITGPAAAWYGVDDLAVALFAMSFMIAFFPLSIPASWLVDTVGFRIPVTAAAVVMGIFGIVRGLAGHDYAVAIGATFVIAATQPFLLNTWTKVPAAWFPSNRRATAVGLVTLANLLGTALGMVLPPACLEMGIGIDAIQTGFGVAALVSAVIFLVLAREKPEVAPDGEGSETRALMLDGLKHALSIPAFWLALAVLFIGLGVFNGITTWVENIVRPRGFTPSDAGTLGALMLLGGVVGAVLIPALSDREGKRRKYLRLTFGLSIPGLFGLIFAGSRPLLFGSAFAFGFFLVSALPIAMQYAAEITRPTPEGTSNGLIQLFGQGAVVFVWLLDALKGPDGSFTRGLLVAAGMLGFSLLLITGMKDGAKGGGSGQAE